MLEINKILDITPLLFILNLSILTNFVGDIMSCKIKYIFTNNIIFKHIIIMLIIYSSISVIYKNVSPFEKVKRTIAIWIMFILLIKNTLRVVSILVILMFLQFILKDYIDYYKNKDPDKKHIDKLNKLNKLNDFLEYFIIVLLVIGHIMYINKQKILFKTDFNYYDLYLSNKKHLETCK